MTENSFETLEARKIAILEALSKCYGERISVASAIEDIDDALTEMKLYPSASITELGSSAAEFLQKDPEAAVDFTLQLTGSDQSSTRAFACIIISRLACFHAGLWVNLSKHLVKDSDWEVREYAAKIFDSSNSFQGVAELHTEFTVEIIQQWTEDTDYLVRRAATSAMLGYYQTHPEFGEKYLQILDSLLNDRSEYVRNNFAAALRTMGKKRPELVIKYIESKLDKLSDSSREIFRLVLEHNFADKFPDKKKELLAKLS